MILQNNELAKPLGMVCEVSGCKNQFGQDYPNRKDAPKGWEKEPIFLCGEHAKELGYDTNKKTEVFKLTGLSKPGSFTLELLDTDKEIFWATSDMPQDRFNALFDYRQNVMLAKCEFDYKNSDGIPVNCKVLEVFEP